MNQEETVRQEDVTNERAIELLDRTNSLLVKAADELLAVKGDLGLEVGRNIKWQQMFEELGQASVSISTWVKRTYLTKQINIQELEAVYILAGRIEQVMYSYQKRKDLVNTGTIKEEEIIDGDKP